MKLNRLVVAVNQILVDAAGADGKLTRTEAKKLPAYLRAGVEAVREGTKKVDPATAHGYLVGGGPNAVPRGLYSEWVEAQRDAQGAIKGPADLSLTERARLTDPLVQEATDLAWTVAEATPTRVEQAPLKARAVKDAAALLTKLLRDADNGDGLTRVVEIQKARFTYLGALDAATTNALVHAVNRAKNEGAADIDSVIKQVELARDEILAGNVDGNATLTDAEQRKTTSVLGKSMLDFAVLHQGHKYSDFGFTPEKIYVPSRPFKAPAGATADEFLRALDLHVNAFSNDNKGAGPGGVSRIVMGDVEAKGMATEIGKLSPAFGKKVLKALEARVQMPTEAIGDPQRIYFTPAGQAVMDGVAKKFKVTCDFAGDPRPPSFNYY